jgi:hypothetical protein
MFCLGGRVAPSLASERLEPGGGGTGEGLVGRSGERRRLRAALEQAGRGHGRICTITGPPGIGKTRLVTNALEAARERGFQALYGGGAELEHRRPFGAVADCLGIRPGAADEALASIADLLVGTVTATRGIPAEAATTEFRLVEAILALVEELCGRGPVAMAVDDLQWADPSTLLLLHRLARYVGELPALLICCWRPVPRRAELDRLSETFTAAGSISIVLGPLAGSDVVELLRMSTGAHPGANLCRLAAAAGGNPLFVSELLASLEREDALEYQEPGQVDVASPSLPPSLPAAILHRLSYLSQEALEVLRVAAILGSRFDVADICLLLGSSPTSLMSAFGELASAGILDDEDGRLVFRHDLIREALYRDLSPSVRAALHRDAARALARAHAPAERVAEHAIRGATAGDPFTVEWLHRAATDVASRAPAVAVDWLDQAWSWPVPTIPTEVCSPPREPWPCCGRAGWPKRRRRAGRCSPVVSTPHSPAVSNSAWPRHCCPGSGWGRGGSRRGRRSRSSPVRDRAGSDPGVGLARAHGDRKDGASDRGGRRGAG